MAKIRIKVNFERHENSTDCASRKTVHLGEYLSGAGNRRKQLRVNFTDVVVLGDEVVRHCLFGVQLFVFRCVHSDERT